MSQLPSDYKSTIPQYSDYSKTLNLHPLSEDILAMRYLKKNSDGVIVEDPLGMLYRVAQNIAQADSIYGEDPKTTELKFFHHLASLDFVPASPILMNAGNRLQCLFSDHALDVPDSIEDIFEVLKIGASIQQNGGGVGFSFSRVRPRHDDVSGMKNVAFGPLSVMNIFDTSFSSILQGGRRSGANMAILNISHPDVLSFITAKNDFSKFQNFNLSVAVTDKFMKAVENDELFDLINPRNGEVVSSLRARTVFDAIVEQAWKTGDPGIIFIDEMNRKYPFKERNVLCTGACGQYELEAFEGVPYAHINLSRLLIEADGKKGIDGDKLKYLVHIMVHFLDNCIDMHKYNHPLIEEKTKNSRKIGLGVMGFADLLFQLGLSYGSDESLEVIRQIMTIIRDESRAASAKLSLSRSPFKSFSKSTWKRPMRNATITSIAPTGSTSLIVHSSQSIEPVYAFSFTTKTNEGKEYTILNEAFKNAVDALPIDRTAKIQLQFVDSIQNISWLDDSFKKIFRTAMDISPEEHLKVMATFQEFVDNSISKTINLPKDATHEEVSSIIKLAYASKCKGITVYRDGCRGDQVLSTKLQTRLSAFEDNK